MSGFPAVLVVDDSENDALLMSIAFKRAGFVHPLRFARDGEDAIAYLKGLGDYGNRNLFPLPSLVLMDLNMPGRNGFEVLQWIRQDPVLEQLCVNILSASSRPQDMERAHDLGANRYLIKPSNLDGLLLIVRELMTGLKTGQMETA